MSNTGSKLQKNRPDKQKPNVVAVVVGAVVVVLVLWRNYYKCRIYGIEIVKHLRNKYHFFFKLINKC